MSNPPAFQLYAADFYMDTASWTPAQVGAYFRLLMHQWINGNVPNKISSLARIAGVDTRNMQKMWSAELAKKFTTDDAGMLVNLRLERTRKDQQERRQRQVESGRAGGLTTQEIKRRSSSNPSSNPSSENQALLSSTSNNTIIDNSIIFSNKRKRKRNIKEKEKEFVLPEGIPVEAWNQFVEMRIKINKPLTTYAKERIIDKLLAIGGDIRGVLDQSTMNSWQGVFPIKKDSRSRDRHSGIKEWLEENTNA